MTFEIESAPKSFWSKNSGVYQEFSVWIAAQNFSTLPGAQLVEASRERFIDPHPRTNTWDRSAGLSALCTHLCGSCSLCLFASQARPTPCTKGASMHLCCQFPQCHQEICKGSTARDSKK